MSTKHTPGPWIWQHWPDGQKTVAEQSTLGTIANVWTSGAGVDMDKANARLLAAAPKLLAALIACLEAQQPMQQAHAAEQARAVIAEATGSTS